MRNKNLHMLFEALSHLADGSPTLVSAHSIEKRISEPERRHLQQHPNGSSACNTPHCPQVSHFSQTIDDNVCNSFGKI
jgi:hypothetical protein